LESNLTTEQIESLESERAEKRATEAKVVAAAKLKREEREKESIKFEGTWADSDDDATGPLVLDFVPPTVRVLPRDKPAWGEGGLGERIFHDRDRGVLMGSVARRTDESGSVSGVGGFDDRDRGVLMGAAARRTDGGGGGRGRGRSGGGGDNGGGRGGARGTGGGGGSRGVGELGRVSGSRGYEGGGGAGFATKVLRETLGAMSLSGDTHGEVDGRVSAGGGNRGRGGGGKGNGGRSGARGRGGDGSSGRGGVLVVLVVLVLAVLAVVVLVVVVVVVVVVGCNGWGRKSPSRSEPTQVDSLVRIPFTVLLLKE